MIKQSLFLASLLLGLTACQSTPQTQLEDLAIEGTWHIESANGQPVIDYSPAELIFAADGKLTGNNSCNNFFGSYVLDGESLQLQPAGNTMKACVDALMAQEQRVMQVMPEVAQAEMAKGKLVLKDADDNTVMVLSKK
ncbi:MULTISPECIES: META domain-containing protein [unclassified Shewanella]|uniref:META domain-containing protein n=1 Tax=unclassified Shewanella TaxID=196818 RepID=UPI001BC77CCD|nr:MULTISPECIES: META domain-containing protein [unclassified Shewanella]GIU07168.1 heat-shock protein HslJ [Shewanella sp. MBTL60-112-B1]GIU35546.1 heat-shock protein HslJ [Shewanella sp. MBTL60-112-B2]